NVFLPVARPGVTAMLLDFGIAKLLESQEGPTTDTGVIGTPRYLSPEQILAGRVDARTDVYAAGLVVFEMIAGRAPFDAGEPMEVMRAHVGDTPRRLRSFARVSTELDHAVMRAVQTAP